MHYFNPGRSQKYLGAPIGINLSTEQLHSFCLNKISLRLSIWSSRMLSFTGQTILIKHVLQAIPIYHIMFLKSSEHLAKKITALSHDFLWGYNPMGGRRIPLIAWERLSLPKVEGGLRMRVFRSHSDSLLSQWFTRALDEPSSEWAQLFGANLCLASWMNPCVIRRNGYSDSDLLLLANPRAFSAPALL